MQTKHLTIRILAIVVLAMVGLVCFEYEKETASTMKSDHPIDWNVYRVEDLNLQQIFKYILWTNSTSCCLTHDIGGTTHDDGVDGQKAVCLDPSVKPETSNYECLVYSFGISNDWTFDEEIVKLGCRVYSFDPSMNVSDHDHSPKIHFYNLGLSDRDEKWNKGPAKNWSMRSLDSIYNNLLKHQNRIIDYLKIDIESSEWIVIPQIISSGMLDRVRQLALEIHLPNKGGIEEFHRCTRIIKSLEDYGLVRFDSKYNPWSLEWNSAVDWEDYLAYEIVWYNSRLFRKSPTTYRPQVTKAHSLKMKKKVRKRMKIKTNRII